MDLSVCTDCKSYHFMLRTDSLGQSASDGFQTHLSTQKITYSQALVTQKLAESETI